MSLLKQEFDSALEKLIADSSKKRFTIVGDIHSDPENILVILPLLESGNFENIFLEGLNKGRYNPKNEALRDNNTYQWNPKKYDLIISNALSAGINVYGINNPNEYGEPRVREWAKYIMKEVAPKGRSLVITGIAHLNYWYSKPDNSNALPLHLIAEGLPETEILGVTALRNLSMPYLREPALHKVDEIEDVRLLSFRTDKISDYLLLYPARYLEI